MGVFDRLGYTFNDPANSSVQTFSTNVANQMAIVPSLLTDWQKSDIAANNVGGYFQNPVANVVQAIWNLSNTYITYTTQNVQNTNPTINTAIRSAMSNAVSIATMYANTYLYITNRQSNVVPAGNDTINVHYTTAIQAGKILTYVINQTDGIQNNAPMIGSFTSIMIGNTLNTLYTTIRGLSNTFAASINTVPSPASSNISLADAQSLQNSMYALATTMYSFPKNDNNFFQNSKQVISDYNALRQVSKLGQTENYLINNYIGTNKLTSRLNPP